MHRRGRLDRGGLILELLFELNDDVLAIRGARKSASKGGRLDLSSLHGAEWRADALDSLLPVSLCDGALSDGRCVVPALTVFGAISKREPALGCNLGLSDGIAVVRCGREADENEGCRGNS